MGPVGCLLQTLAASLAALAQLSPNPSPGDQRKGQIPSRGCGLVPQVWSPPTPPAPARSVLSVLSVTPACVGSARVSLRHPLPFGVLAPNPAARCPLALKALAAFSRPARCFPSRGSGSARVCLWPRPEPPRAHAAHLAGTCGSGCPEPRKGPPMPRMPGDPQAAVKPAAALAKGQLRA